MLKLKKGLANVIESISDKEYTVEESQTESAYDLRQTTSMQVHQPTRHATSVQFRSSANEWEELLVKLLAMAPEDVAYRLVNCLDVSSIVQMLEQKKNDPYVKVALLLLKK